MKIHNLAAVETIHIGAGSVVTKAVLPDTKVIGMPARAMLNGI